MPATTTWKRGQRWVSDSEPELGLGIILDGSHGRVDESAYGLFGLGGPAAPGLESDGPVDATTVTPTLLEVLGLEDEVSL